MVSFKDFISELRLRYTVYKVIAGKAFFSEYLNHDELDDFMLKTKLNDIVVVGSNGNWVHYLKGPKDEFEQVRRGKNNFEETFKPNKSPDLD